jgi:hypothetical protein
MSNTLTVDENNIGFLADSFVSLHENGQFPVRKKTGDIRHGNAQPRIAITDKTQLGKGENTDARVEISLFYGHIGTGYGFDTARVRNYPNAPG